MPAGIENLTCAIACRSTLKWQGRVVAVNSAQIAVSGLGEQIHVGDTVAIEPSGGKFSLGEVAAIEANRAIITPEGSVAGLRCGDKVIHVGAAKISPNDTWIGRILDPNGTPLDGKPLLNGTKAADIHANPPTAALRRHLGPRLETGMALFNTILPIARGQRIGLFAGSGVGKTTLLGRFATGIQADLIIISLVGERGRELNEFVGRVLGPEAMKRTIVVAATSDQPAMIRRRCALTAMATAEYFRDQGLHVLLILDSLTRFAEAHREIALASGEVASSRGFPATTMPKLATLCERAGTGTDVQGDITAIFSVLVAGSDMEEPIADMVRGILDGHFVLDREIAERGRFPAVHVQKSVSRSLPDAASPTENETISRARKSMALFDQSELMLRAGLYTHGLDPDADAAIASMPELELFFGAPAIEGIQGSFERLQAILDSCRTSIETAD